jgi:ATP/maltotriose-dependent transcriptional regulator MalT
LLAQTLYAQDRLAEAEELATAAAAIAADDDIEPQAGWRSVKAKILARQRETAEAVVLARAAVELLGQTDDVPSRIESLIDLAEVLAAAGDEHDARAALQEARELCRAKQLTIQLGRVDALLDALPLGSVPQQA